MGNVDCAVYASQTVTVTRGGTTRAPVVPITLTVQRYVRDNAVPAFASDDAARLWRAETLARCAIGKLMGGRR